MAFDPYTEWLGIRTERRPPTHYELLGLTQFEADPQRIRDEAQTRYALVHRYQAGRHSELAVRLLAKITEARETLCDPVRKAQYDASLGGGPTVHVSSPEQHTLLNAPSPKFSTSAPLAASSAAAPSMPLAPMRPPTAVTSAPLPAPVPSPAADNPQPPMPWIETGSATHSGLAGGLFTPDPSGSWTRRCHAERRSFAGVAARLVLDNRTQSRGWVWFAAGAASMYAVMLLMQVGQITQPGGASLALSGENKPASVTNDKNNKRHAAPPTPSSVARRSERADAKPAPSQPDGPSPAGSARDDQLSLAPASQTPSQAGGMPRHEPAPAATPQLPDSPPTNVPVVLETFTNSMGMKFLLIPPATL